MAKKRPDAEPESEEGEDMAEILRQAIRECGESLNQLGDRAGLDSARLSRFMRGERDLTFEAAAKLCNALGLHLAGGKGRSSSISLISLL